MSLEIGSALSSGVEKLATRAGLTLAGVYLVVQLLSAFSINTVLVGVLPPEAVRPSQIGVVLPLPGSVAGALVLLGMVASLLLTVAVIRTVAHDATELGSVPDDAFDRLLATTAFLLVANVIVGVAVAIGFVLLVVPGVFLAVSLTFTQVYVVLEDENPFEAMSSSWSLAKGNRFSLLLLGLVVFAVSLLVGAVGTVASMVSPAVGTVLQVAVSAPMFVFGNAVLVDAYRQLEAAEPEDVGALTADELEG